MSTKNLFALAKLTPEKREEVIQSAATKVVVAYAKKLLTVRKAELETKAALEKMMRE
ncbi:MAG: hypothetical protein ACE1Y1_01710 [Nitrosomonadaceae bacterium]